MKVSCMSFKKTTLPFLLLLSLATGHLNARAAPTTAHPELPGLPADTIKLIDSLYHFFWRTNIGYWVNEDLDLYYYDQNTDLLKWSRKHWDESYGYIWYDDYRVVYTLVDRMTVEEMKQNYDLQASQWINSTLFTYTYDGQGNKTGWKWQRWSPELNDWSNFRLNQYFYDGAGHDILSVASNWDDGIHDWIPSQKVETSYDSSGADTLILTSYWSEPDSAWIALSRKRNGYDLAGNKVTEQLQQWDAETSSWINSSYNLLIYDVGDKLSQTIYQRWDADLNKWIELTMNEYFYNEMALISQYITSTRNPSDTVWTPAARGMYEYDGDGDRTEFVLQEWDGQGDWINHSRLNYAYRKVLSLPESGSSTGISCYWTRHAQEDKCLRCDGLKNGQPYVFTLYSMQGSLIYNQVFTGGQAVALKGTISSGIFIFTVAGEDQLLHRGKIVIP